MGRSRSRAGSKRTQDAFGKRHRRFGEVARRLGLVEDSDVRLALQEQSTASPRRKIGEILVTRGKLTPSDVERVLAYQLGKRRLKTRGRAAEK